MKVSEAAKLLGMNPQTLRIALQYGDCPYGFAIKRKRWVYHIFENRVREEIGK